MSNQLLKGKKGIISGALNDKSIAWKVAEKAYEQGAEIVLTNAPIAMRMGEINELSANYEWYKQTLDVSATSLHKMLATAWKKDAINDWGSVVALTYIAAQRIFPDYNDMADAKSLLESIARSFGYHYGTAKKVRINTISQSPTVTTAGSGVKGFDGFINYSEAMSPLGNADANACADYCVAMFSDLTRYVTMQNLFHDGGFSITGVTQEVVEKFATKE